MTSRETIIRAWTTGKYDEAEAQLTQLLLDGTDPDLLALRSSVRVAQGQLFLAKQDAECCVVQKPGWFKAHSCMATVLGLEGNFEEALAAVDRALQLAPDVAILVKQRTFFSSKIAEACARDVVDVILDGMFAPPHQSQEQEQPQQQPWSPWLPEWKTWLEKHGYLSETALATWSEHRAWFETCDVKDLLREQARLAVKHRSDVGAVLTKKDARHVMCLASALSSRARDHPRAPLAVAHLCRLMQLDCEACGIEEQFHEEGGGLPDHQDAADICFFPSRIRVCENIPSPRSIWTLAPLPRNRLRNEIQHAFLKTHHSVYVAPSIVSSCIVVLLIRHPLKLLSRIGPESWVGLHVHSAQLFLTSFGNMTMLLDAVKLHYGSPGSELVWFFQKKHYYRAVPKELREQHERYLCVPSDMGIYLSREFLEWVIRFVPLAH